MPSSQVGKPRLRRFSCLPRAESWRGAEPGLGPENPESRGHVLPCPKDWALATSLPPKPGVSPTTRFLTC